MDGVRTKGHPAALASVTVMIRGAAPHAVLLVGPNGVGKTTLALDLASGLLCTAESPSARPCGACRACRLVAGGVHPDVHVLRAEGPGRQVVIGGAGSRARGVRDLIADLALLPVEGGARIAIIESAQRMNDDAQAALLKTLEEPPDGVTLVLCADTEEPLLPTIRSRCARIRLGPVATEAVAAILAEHDIDDPPLAARLARIAVGRPGMALAWAGDPDALLARDELVRVLLDMTAERPSERLRAVRSAVATAGPIVRLTERGGAPSMADAAEGAAAERPGPGRRRRTGGTVAVAADVDDPETDPSSAPRGSASERRRAAEAVVDTWTDVARDLALATRGIDASLRDPRLLEEMRAVASQLDQTAVTAFLDRLGRASVLLAANASPELVLDDLSLAWPRQRSTVT